MALAATGRRSNQMKFVLLLLSFQVPAARITEVVDVAICKGGGTYPGGGTYDCTGMIRFSFRTNNGTFLGPFVAFSLPPPGTNSPLVWTPVK